MLSLPRSDLRGEERQAVASVGGDREKVERISREKRLPPQPAFAERTIEQQTVRLAGQTNEGRFDIRCRLQLDSNGKLRRAHGGASASPPLALSARPAEDFRSRWLSSATVK